MAGTPPNPTPAAGFVPVWTAGDRLRKARELADIGVAEMADRLGRERNTITRWERSKTAQRMVVRLYAMETGVSEAWLEAGGMAPEPGPATTELRPRSSRKQVRPAARCIPQPLMAA